MSLLVRASVAHAARDLVPLWPLESFIAVNPLASQEGAPFADAVATGAVPVRDRAEFAADISRGRITAVDLSRSLAIASLELLTMNDVTIAGALFSPLAVAVAEMRSAPVFPPTTSPAPLLDRVDHVAADQVAAYLDTGTAWSMPDRDAGMYVAWRRMADHDTRLPRRARAIVRSLPESADAALSAVLEAFGVVGDRVDAVLKAELERLPGYSAHIKWRSEHVGDIDLTSYLALRLSLRLALDPPPAGSEDRVASDVAGVVVVPETLVDVHDRARRLLAHLLGHTDHSSDDIAVISRILSLHPAAQHPTTFQRAYELHYRDELLARIGTPEARPSRPRAQVVMCIDPRSEGFRRHLETDPQIETLGFAGFFGVPMRYASHAGRGTVDALPALLSPRHSVTEAADDAGAAAARTAALRVRDALSAGAHAGETVMAAPFAFAETAGWLMGVASALRTIAPATAARLSRRIGAVTAKEVACETTVSTAFDQDERVTLAETAVRMMGLDRLAPLVLLTGHGSTSTNNLYQSALDCGACGGNPGGDNARAAAGILNDPGIREQLASRGILIPDDTVFVAAVHDTVDDRITVRDRHLVPADLDGALSDFDAAQRRAGDLLVLERATQLPGASARSSVRRLRRRAHDWAEVYPELGLVGNAAMIIGPREITRGVDLGRRVFLHSYRAALDPTGAGLETILTAPVVVAQWINHQYYFSTVSPHHHGAGTKTIHNAIGTIGVLSGGSGDLRTGLPWQSVGVGAATIHEPMRLTVVVVAPLERIGEIVARNQVLRNLFDNEWITLVARSDDEDPWCRYGSYGWQPIKNSPTEPEGERR